MKLVLNVVLQEFAEFMIKSVGELREVKLEQPTQHTVWHENLTWNLILQLWQNSKIKPVNWIESII